MVLIEVLLCTIEEKIHLVYPNVCVGVERRRNLSDTISRDTMPVPKQWRLLFVLANLGNKFPVPPPPINIME